MRVVISEVMGYETKGRSHRTKRASAQLLVLKITSQVIRFSLDTTADYSVYSLSGNSKHSTTSTQAPSHAPISVCVNMRERVIFLL